jgi:hypothetical protein
MVHLDVTVAYPDRRVECARLGPEDAPGGLVAGEPALVTRVQA